VGPGVLDAQVEHGRVTMASAPIQLLGGDPEPQHLLATNSLPVHGAMVRHVADTAAYTARVTDSGAGQAIWLDEDEQRSWRALLMGMTLLLDRLDDDLRRNCDLSLVEYEILVRLSERPGRQMRMAQLADALAHSRSRVTHTVTRMERAGLIVRSSSPEDGRGVVASMTDKGYDLIVRMAPIHVSGVRAHLVDLVSREDFAALGRVMDAVSDNLVAGHPEMELRRD
jgi:DNA-binding MarR family transcriptional regulator